MDMTVGKPLTACVTGASGMIGRRIVERLLARGYLVRALSRGRYANPRVQLFKAGLSDESELNRFIDGADMVFHCAAELNDASKMREVNVQGTERIVKLIRQHGIKYFCHVSSAGVVGSTSEILVDETTPCNPQNAYERSKWEAEQVAAGEIAGCSTVILRPTNVIDKKRLGELSLPVSGSFKSRLKAFVKGGECAHIVHAEDVADAAIYFIDRLAQKPRVFFVSCDDDPLNTVAGLWSLYHALADGHDGTVVTPIAHLPLAIPYFVRRLWRGGGNRGNVKYSSRRLIAEGFIFPLGVTGAVRKIIQDRCDVQ